MRYLMKYWKSTREVSSSGYKRSQKDENDWSVDLGFEPDAGSGDDIFRYSDMESSCRRNNRDNFEVDLDRLQTEADGRKSRG
jgi:hypothetical protein